MGKEAAEPPVMETRRYDELDDKTLIALCISDDSDAWSEFVSRYSNYVYAVLSDFPKDDRDDIYQIVFETLIKNNFGKLKKFEGRSKFTTWLGTFTRHCGYDYIRQTNKQTGKKIKGGERGQKKRENEEPEIEDIKDSSGETALKHVLKEHNAKKLKKLLAGLAPRDRMLLELRYFQDKSYKEIAQILNIPINTVSSGMSRAIEKLRKLLDDEEDI